MAATPLPEAKTAAVTLAVLYCFHVTRLDSFAARLVRDRPGESDEP